MIKPLITIQEKCRECEEGKILDKTNTFSNKFPQYKDCKSCSGTGKQETEIYALRDFEKCHVCFGIGILKLLPKKLYPDRECNNCNGTGYKIYYKKPKGKLIRIMY